MICELFVFYTEAWKFNSNQFFSVKKGDQKIGKKNDPEFVLKLLVVK